ncbi:MULTISPECIES: NAD(P)H-dependent flavin oxidoreductase [Pontibacillus]|uniref:Probable nitronate monooxygenase n=1 Tax=Pontibacillus chungwhensis TaxID=265426 RepID=A0ABY8USL8_9BACI|nr:MULTISPECIES: nitronate monooxygenase [Pontibacillus]MCD5323283.1 nitronate monooxygenase [Pontibacillus sp. HN14]WIF96666.1 nitronate monooxygenase [Pontibacillus chungwhensis]
MNDLCRVLNLQYPILQGGMGNVSNAQLSAAVSEAGGLGTVGVGTMEPDEVKRILKDLKVRTKQPIALNIPLNVTPYRDEMIELVVGEKVPVVSLSAGNPAPFIPYFQEYGVKVIAVVASKRQAQKAEEAGADVIVAEGYEAAGINSNFETTTLTLIPQIVDAVSVPVVAAGGIGDGRGLAAVLALGASGVQMGTRLIATSDSPMHNSYKEALLKADDIQTVIVGRSIGKVRRVMKTPYAGQLLTLEEKGIEEDDFNRLTSEYYHKLGALDGKLDQGFINGGQVSGLIHNLPTVQELFESMMEEASGCFQSLSKTYSLTKPETK